MARPRQISDEQILTTTKRCVLDHGPHVSLELVADELGVTSPALLKRFGSRKQLMLRALVPPHTPPWTAQLEKGPDERPLVEQLEELFRGISSFFAEMVPCISALRESGIGHEEMMALHGDAPPIKNIKAMAAWLRAGAARGLLDCEHFESAATAIMGGITTRQWLGHMYKHHWSERSEREHVRELALFFSRALAPATPAPATKRGRP